MPSYFKSAAAGLVAGLVVAGAVELFEKVTAPVPGKPTGEDGSVGHALAELAHGPAGEAVPFVTGAALGLGYGVLVALAPSLRGGFGTGYGLAASALTGNPAPLPGAAPSSGGSMVGGALSQLVVGAALEGVRHVLVDAGKPKAG